MDELTADGSGSIVVLLIDDQPYIGAVVRQLLSSAPSIELHCCHEPLDAMRVAGQLRPAIVLLDLVMPGIDGFALLSELVADPATAKTPVIVLSGNDDPQTRRAALAQGATDFVVKLPSAADLIDGIRRHANATLVSHEQREEPAAGDAPADDRTLDPGVLEGFRQVAPAGHADMTTLLVDLFLSEAAGLLEKLRQAQRSSDPQALKAAAHRLRGSSLTIGARRLAALSAQLEDHAGRGSSGVVASVLVKQLDAEFINLRQALAALRGGTDGP